MQEIPLQAAPTQQTKVVVGGQNCQISLYQKAQGLFVDINSDGIEIVTGIIARDAVPVVCRQYAGFTGDFIFIDTQGSSDPTYDGLGSRYALVYLTADENDLVQQ